MESKIYTEYIWIDFTATDGKRTVSTNYWKIDTGC